MGNFIAKAFVRIKEDSKRNEVVKTLERIGYECLYGGSVGDNVIVIKEGFMAIDYTMPCDCINCLDYANGDEDLAVKLFLALAEMQRFKDTNQWFKRITVDGIEYVKHSQKLICKIGVRAFDRDCFPLTPHELAEAVKNGRIKL